jgi:hypothetical protein
MARALELFWDRQSDESAHLLVPRIESTIRDMARRSGLTVMREPIGEKPGGTRTLGILLLELQGAMPDDGWHDYIYNVLADQFGLNLRNEIAPRSHRLSRRRRRSAAAARRPVSATAERR